MPLLALLSHHLKMKFNCHPLLKRKIIAIAFGMFVETFDLTELLKSYSSRYKLANAIK